jgi:segregation and condensation protein A
MLYEVVLPEFQGPLDLLLHLINIHELDIFDIPIAFITGQYMDYLRKAREIDLSLSGDFIVMAGDLLVIKAKTLLPRRVSSDDEGQAEADPREELTRKLLEYRLYKENALKLKDLETSEMKIFFRETSENQLLSLFPRPNPVGDLSPGDLKNSFLEVMRLMAARDLVITVRKESISVREKMSCLTKMLRASPRGIRFDRILADCADAMEAVTTFLALLELLAKGIIWARQKELFGDIYIGATKVKVSRV